jgi:hypothetical protein
MHLPNCKKWLVTSSCLFVSLPTWNDLASTGWIFMKFDIWVFFKTLWKKFKLNENWTRIRGNEHKDQHTFLIPHSILLRMQNVLDKSCRENQNTHFMLNNISFTKSWHLWDNVEKYCRIGQATDDNMANVHCMLHTKDCKYTLRLCYSYCISTPTMITWTHLKVTLYIHFLSCSSWIE